MVGGSSSNWIGVEIMQRGEGQNRDDLRSLGNAPLVGSADEQEEPETLVRRVLRPQTFISFAIAVAILVFFVRRFEIGLDAVWRQVREANPWLYGLAFVLWYGSFGIRAIRWRQMLVRAGVDRTHGYAVPGIGG